tara:strand:- start:445 stop:699 length:255 start_codon:yes stop_codon:yes gene_type:complete
LKPGKIFQILLSDVPGPNRMHGLSAAYHAHSARTMPTRACHDKKNKQHIVENNFDRLCKFIRSCMPKKKYNLERSDTDAWQRIP